MKQSQLTFRIPPALDARLGDLATRMGLTRADLVRHAVNQMLPKIEAEGIVIRPTSAGAPLPSGHEGRAA